MKKLLAIIFIIHILSATSFAGDFYLKGTTPYVLIESGYKLFSINTHPDPDSVYDVIYTFTKDKNIVSCKVRLDSSSGNPLYSHYCYNITGASK